MVSVHELEARIEALENENEYLRERQEELARVVNELSNLTAHEMHDTPLSVFEAKTWKHPEMAIHLYDGVEEMVDEEPSNYVHPKTVKRHVAEVHGHSKAVLKSTLKQMIRADVIKERDGRIKIHPDATDIDPDELFIDNMNRTKRRRKEAASRGKAVDNPGDTRRPNER